MSGEGVGRTVRFARRTRRWFAVGVSAFAGLMMVCSVSCSPSSSSSAAGTSCRATAGTCVLGGATCAKQAASGAQDCNPPPANPGGAFCCLELQDGGITGASDGGPDAYSGPCTFSASDYDPSCNADRDCVLVARGDYCLTGGCLCLGSNSEAESISVDAQARFNADVAKTPQGMEMPDCGCPTAVVSGPCCRGGTCQATGCFSAADTLPSCADAGGSCTGPALYGCQGLTHAGPPGACVYSDEICCIQ